MRPLPAIVDKNQIARKHEQKYQSLFNHPIDVFPHRLLRQEFAYNETEGTRISESLGEICISMPADRR